MKIKELGSSKIKIEFEDTQEAELFDFLYNIKLIKGAYAYKPMEYVEIDTKAYSTQYIVEPDKETEKVEKPVHDPLFDFLK